MGAPPTAGAPRPGVAPSAVQPGGWALLPQPGGQAWVGPRAARWAAGSLPCSRGWWAAMHGRTSAPSCGQASGACGGSGGPTAAGEGAAGAAGEGRPSAGSEGAAGPAAGQAAPPAAPVAPDGAADGDRVAVELAAAAGAGLQRSTLGPDHCLSSAAGSAQPLRP